jgi:acylphosphatase
MPAKRQLRKTAIMAASLVSALVAIPVVTQAKGSEQKLSAVSGVVTGNVQKVGFRAMIQKQAIEYNLAGMDENNTDGSVHFTLQGDSDRIARVLEAIKEGPKKASNVSVTTSAAKVSPDLKTFTVIGWTSVSRDITHPYNLVFELRDPDSIIKKHKAKAVWLEICEKTVQGEDAGKCDKHDDD